MKGWGKGILFINGANLGRYWSVGPQRTLYVPGPLLKEGVNKVSVCHIYSGVDTVCVCVCAYMLCMYAWARLCEVKGGLCLLVCVNWLCYITVRMCVPIVYMYIILSINIYMYIMFVAFRS